MYDMTIRLRTDSDKCLYQQIYEHIRQEIREGKLLAGERLPSTRSLAEYLQVARSTVDYAYDQLLSEGYIEAKPYKGYFVCRLEGIFTMEQQEMTEPEVVRPDSQEDGTQVQVDFSPYGIDMTGFPFGVWKRITKNILNDSNSELFAQGEPQGDYDLRMTISRYLHSSRGVNCRPEQIIVGAGNDYLLLLLEKILGRHVGIAMENPTYKRAYRIFQSFAYRIYTVDMDDKGMRADRLSGLPVRAAYVMPSHQYPTGAVMTIGRRAELLRWAEKEPDRYLIEDDYDSEFRYRGKPIPSLQSSDKRGKVIYIGTFSKAIAPAIRVSYMVLPESLLEVYRRDCSFYSCTVSRIDQRILNEFIRDGYFERHLNKMRMHYRAKHDLLLAELEPFKKAFTISGEDAGLHLLLTARGAVTEAQLLSAATEAGVKVYGMSENMVETDAPKATILLGFGSVSEPEMKEGLH
ncbi:MAG: PLP-dependent aminotransferase family protein, partial [Acetatifactor sp.]|nr:PLP-dependent aminotransferase family protein [Acetatifactor sp.]